MMPKLMDLPMLAGALCMTEAEVKQLVKDGEIPAPRSGTWNWESVDNALTHGKDREFVYFAQMCDFIKIGRSKDVCRRIQSFEGFMPMAVKLLHQVPGTCDLETDIHRRFKHLRVKGEWFQYTGELVEFVEAVKAGTDPKQVLSYVTKNSI